MLRTRAVICLTTLLTPALSQSDTPEPVSTAVAALGSTDLGKVRRAERQLVRFGASAVAPLCEALRAAKRGKSTDMQIAILRTLRLLAPHAAAAVEPVTEAREGARRSLRRHLLRTLEAIAPYAPDQRQQLEIAALRWPTLHVTRLALRLRLSTKSTTAELLEALEGDNTYLRELAADLLGTRATEKTKILPALRAAFAAAISPKEPPSPGAVMLELRDADGNVRMSVAGIPGRIRLEPISVARALVRIARPGELPRFTYSYLLNAEDSELVRTAALHLGTQGHDAVGAVPDLTRLAGSKDRYVALEAITALGLIGPDAKYARPTLRKLLESQDKATVVRAKVALGQIGAARDK